MIPCTCNFADLGAICSVKMALQAPAGPFSQNRLLLHHTPSSAVMNHCRRTRATGSSAEGSPRARPVWRATCLYEAAAESACRQYRVARWFLLPEAELRPRIADSNSLQICDNKRQRQITLQQQQQIANLLQRKPGFVILVNRGWRKKK